MSSKPTIIVANGSPAEVVLPCSVADFLHQHGWKTSQVVVEYNGKVLSKKSLSSLALIEGDRIEIIVPVAGG
jgi:thiamine biosynthesis protein ThiS